PRDLHRDNSSAPSGGHRPKSELRSPGSCRWPGSLLLHHNGKTPLGLCGEGRSSESIAESTPALHRRWCPGKQIRSSKNSCMGNENRLYSISLGVASLQGGLVGVATALSPATCRPFQVFSPSFFVGLELSPPARCLLWSLTQR